MLASVHCTPDSRIMFNTTRHLSSSLTSSMRMRNSSLMLLLGKTVLAVIIFFRAFMWGICQVGVASK